MLWLLIDIIRHPLTGIINYAAGNIDYAICYSILWYYRLRHVSFYCSYVHVSERKQSLTYFHPVLLILVWCSVIYPKKNWLGY